MLYSKHIENGKECFAKKKRFQSESEGYFLCVIFVWVLSNSCHQNTRVILVTTQLFGDYIAACEKREKKKIMVYGYVQTKKKKEKTFGK